MREIKEVSRLRFLGMILRKIAMQCCLSRDLLLNCNLVTDLELLCSKNQ
jgi:hypothetical protein